MAEPRCILHIGAPKCGSSALQAALTAAPDHRDSSGQRYRYVGTGTVEGQIYPLYGGVVRRLGRSSEFGYSCWPNLRASNLPQSGTADPVWAALQRVMQNATRQDHVPILSNEGWIGAAAAFGQGFLAKPGRRAEVVAFVRPPLDWVNAAYWQWGVWTGYGFRDWLRLSKMRYALGGQLAQWAGLDAVTLHVGGMGQDVVAGFGQRFGLDLASGQAVNSAAAPAFIGLQLRHRKFRRDGHDSAVEFVLQRWCGRYTARKPWAIAPEDIAAVQAESAADVAALLAVCAPGDAQALLQDPRWLSAEPYHRSTPLSAQLEDREGLAELHHALLAGLRAAHASARSKPPVLPPTPAVSADLQVWDAALVPALEALIAADLAVRNRLVFWRSKARDLAGIYQRLKAGLRG
ncbi:hypothetical protein [Cypionkella sp.]|uniref:hypothetical protein n=1 Tax=Cypionkella sp. TaxID=2811411 RepID=UPI002AB947C2|nr:hypothetical protein [Cypionkella sp.]MDZ4393504.1 hypothetical protein [Cypionkella sp.]